MGHPLQISTGFASWQRYCTASSVYSFLGRIAELRTQMRPVATDVVARYTSFCPQYKGDRPTDHATRSVTIVSPAKTTEPIGMSFGFWAQVGLLDGVHIGATWRIRLNRPCAAAMRPFCQISSTALFFFRLSHRSPR